MREPPLNIDSEELLAAVRSEWDADVTCVEHVPVGFGAHHWVAYDVDGPRLFVTFERLDQKRSVEDVAASYAGAVALRRTGLDFVVAPLLDRGGSPLVPFSGGALSCTPWCRGKSGGELDVVWTRQALGRLHAAPPPAGIPRWRPRVTPEFAADVERSLQQPWGPGPFAESARTTLGEHLVDLATWTARYHALATCAR